MSKSKHPVADAFAHLAAMMHESDVGEMPTLVFNTEADFQRVLMALQDEVSGDPAYFDHLAVIGSAPQFYGISFQYEGQFNSGVAGSRRPMRR